MSAGLFPVIVKVVFLLLLTIVLVQDLQRRSISVLLIPGLAISAFYLAAQNQSIISVFTNWGINVLFLGFHLVVLSLYFSARQRKAIFITNGLLGWGDVLFWLAVAPYFSPFNYMGFFICSLLFALVAHGILFQFYFYKKQPHVPLAGLQAIVLAAVLVVSFLNVPWVAYHDGFLLNALIIK